VKRAMPDRTPSRPRSWLPAGLLGKPTLFGSPLEGPAHAADIAALVAAADALATMKDPVTFMRALIEDRAAARR
jgi:hypothetical protein